MISNIIFNKHRRIRLVLLFLLIFSNNIYSQECDGNQLTISLDNYKIVSNTSFEFDVFVSNSGSTKLNLAAIQGGIIYDELMIKNGSMITFNVVNQPGDTSFFSQYNDLTIKHSESTNQLRWIQKPLSISTGKTKEIPFNKSVKFARFKLTSSLPFQTDFISKMKFQFEPKPGFTNVVATVYCNDNSNSIALKAMGAKNEIENSNDFSVIANPNPFREGFGIKVTTSNLNTLNIRVYNLLGSLIEEINSSPEYSNELNIGKNYISGIYTILISQSDNTKTIKMIKL